ncbi:hypothetical protein [Salinarimonas soli]|uniref:Uncharacterized protein n=1 Tax=Salinarimonas soli TaxID=1638099 RepID=A0A5B2VGD3_9HYPH|nr:hypothetical protein [Salinarimonas soli]KAA2237688.1 hypothetical protein F0L46_08390 [Salinarimonas soli]
MSEERARQWDRRFERFEDAVARCTINGAYGDAGRALGLLSRAYRCWGRELFLPPRRRVVHLAFRAGEPVITAGI